MMDAATAAHIADYLHSIMWTLFSINAAIWLLLFTRGSK